MERKQNKKPDNSFQSNTLYHIGSCRKRRIIHLNCYGFRIPWNLCDAKADKSRKKRPLSFLSHSTLITAYALAPEETEGPEQFACGRPMSKIQ